jgi:hypothetical protein
MKGYTKRLHSIPRFGHTTSIAQLLVGLPIQKQQLAESEISNQQQDCLIENHNKTNISTSNSNPSTTNDNFRTRRRTTATGTSSTFSYYANVSDTTTNKTICSNTNNTSSFPSQYQMNTMYTNGLLQNQHLQYFAGKDDYIEGVRYFFFTIYIAHTKIIPCATNPTY